jgi:hypothetical protein
MKKLILPLLLATVLSATAQTDFGSLILNHQIDMGMTFGDVVAAWGNPQNMSSVPVSPGAPGASDAWSYPQAVVLFKDGRVSCVHRCDPANGQ